MYKLIGFLVWHYLYITNVGYNMTFFLKVTFKLHSLLLNIILHISMEIGKRMEYYSDMINVSTLITLLVILPSAPFLIRSITTMRLPSFAKQCKELSPSYSGTISN